MSILLDDKSLTSHTTGYRFSNKRNPTGPPNPDSPRTIEACLELGINPEELIERPRQEFEEPHVEPGITKIRYEHYLQRYSQTCKEVALKRKDLSKHRGYGQPAGSQTQLNRSSRHTRGGSTTNLNSSPNNNSRNQGMRGSLTLNNSSLVPANLLANYTKTVSYLRSSFGSPQVRNAKELDLQEDDETRAFDNQLQHEVDKFNQIKKMKQKEALRTYEEDLKRIKLMTDIKEREQRKKDLEKKAQDDSKKNREEHRKRVEEKMKSIHDREKYYNDRRTKEEIRIKQTMERKKQKLEEEQEHKLRQLQENEQRLAEKKRKADELREQLEIQEEEGIQMLSQKINDRIMESHEKHEQVLNGKMEYFRSKMDKLSEKVSTIKEQRVQREEEFIHGLVDKVKEKERRNQELDKKREQLNKERMKALKEKNEKFSGNTHKLKQQEFARVNELQERKMQAGKRVEERKRQDQENIKLKQELRRLKMLDTQENHERKKRMMEYEQEKILEKERLNREKINLMRTQKEMVQKARLEAAMQSKLERDRISEAILQMGKKIRLKGDESDDKEIDPEEEKKADAQLQQSQVGQPPQNGSPTEQASPNSKINKHLKKLHEKGLRMLSNVVQLDENEIQEIDDILQGQSKGMRRSSSTKPRKKTLGYKHIAPYGLRLHMDQLSLK